MTDSGYRLRRGTLRMFSRLPARLKRSIVGLVKPSYTISALCRIQRPDGTMLVVRTSYREGWVFPGGLCDRGEGPAETARREALEEVGLAVELDPSPVALVDPSLRRIDFLFRAEVASDADDGIRLDRAEITEHRWVAIDQVSALEQTDKSSVSRVIRASESGRSIVVVQWQDLDGPVVVDG